MKTQPKGYPMEFSLQMQILSAFLCTDYHVVGDGYITSAETDCVVWNVMELEGDKDAIMPAGRDGYVMEGDVSDLDTISEEDVVCNEWYGDYYGSESDVASLYKDCDDYTVIWVHPVKSGDVTLEVATGNISGGENSRYDTPRAFVVINHQVHPLES